MKYGHLWHTPVRIMLIGPVVWMPLLIGLENLMGSLKYHQEWHTDSFPQHAKFQIHCWITWIFPRDCPHVLEEVAILAQGVRRVPQENRLPNCTGEEMALYGIFLLAEDLGRDGMDDDEYLAIKSIQIHLMKTSGMCYLH